MKWDGGHRALAGWKIGKRPGARVNKHVRSGTGKNGRDTAECLRSGILQSNEQVPALIGIQKSILVGILELHSFEKSLRSGREGLVRHDNSKTAVAIISRCS